MRETQYISYREVLYIVYSFIILLASYDIKIFIIVDGTIDRSCLCMARNYCINTVSAQKRDGFVHESTATGFTPNFFCFFLRIKWEQRHWVSCQKNYDIICVSFYFGTRKTLVNEKWRVKSEKDVNLWIQIILVCMVLAMSCYELTVTERLKWAEYSLDNYGLIEFTQTQPTLQILIQLDEEQQYLYIVFTCYYRYPYTNWYNCVYKCSS